MKLHEVADFIKQVINVLIVVVFVIASIIYVRPIFEQIFSQLSGPKEVEVAIKYTLPQFIITRNEDLNYDLTNSRILYIGNLEAQWTNYQKKTLPVYEYNFSTAEDIEYGTTARRIAAGLGYDNQNIIDSGDISGKFIWKRGNVIFEINKLNKRMAQAPANSDLSTLKEYINAGNFITSVTPQTFVEEFLRLSGRFTSQEIDTMVYEPKFLKYESNQLTDNNNTIGAELAYLKAYRSLEGVKVVSKKYEFPHNFFYVASLNPGVERDFKNYRFPLFRLNKVEYKKAYEGELFDVEPLPSVVNRKVISDKNFVIADIKINNTPFGYQPPKDSKIRIISIEEFELGYYDNYDTVALNNTVQPIYIFKGSLEMENGERGKITLYTPAIDPKYYSAVK